MIDVEVLEEEVLLLTEPYPGDRAGFALELSEARGGRDDLERLCRSQDVSPSRVADLSTVPVIDDGENLILDLGPKGRSRSVEVNCKQWQVARFRYVSLLALAARVRRRWLRVLAAWTPFYAFDGKIVSDERMESIPSDIALSLVILALFASFASAAVEPGSPVAVPLVGFAVVVMVWSVLLSVLGVSVRGFVREYR